MRALLTGVSGMVGSNLAVAFQERGWSVVGTFYSTPVSIRNCDLHQVLLTEPGALAVLVDKSKPDVVIHCAASVELSALEIDEDLVKKNVAITASALAAAEHWGCTFVLVSSDWVFSGEQPFGSSYLELDSRAPVNAYGRSKAQSETLVEASRVPHLISRPANVYGVNLSMPLNLLSVEQHIWSRSSLAVRMLNELRHGREVLGPDSIIQNPTSAWSYAQRTADLIEAGVEGAVNTAGPHAMSRLIYLEELARAFDMDPDLVRLASVSEMLTSQGESEKLPLPSNTSLSDERLRGLVGATESTTIGFETFRSQIESVLLAHHLK